ncbi:MAG: hypothetical protein Q8P61_03585 [Candidatus Nanopelagicales bacterium]|nr:hypothetical protein [Candidatus Nanopelagicales bacterium]
MSVAQVVVGGTRRLVGLKPANTNEATMFTAGSERPVVVQIVVANNTGSAAAATIKWGDGSTDYDVISGKSIGANDSWIQDIFLPLFDAYTIKVTSGTGNALTFTLAIVEYSGALGGRN